MVGAPLVAGEKHQMTAQPANPYSLADKVGIVTGASRGIGRSCATRLAALGANLVVAARGATELERLASEVSAGGVRCLPVPTDITQPDQVQKLVDTTIEAFGRIDFLVNVPASVDSFGELISQDDETWDDIMGTKLKAYWRLSKLVARTMIPRRSGAIVNLSGHAGFHPELLLGIYSIAQCAVMHLTRAMAGELGRYNVRVNAVAPGITRTEFAKPLYDTAIKMNIFKRVFALERIAEPDEIAHCVAFLVSDAASYINGHVLAVDGGMKPLGWWG